MSVVGLKREGGHVGFCGRCGVGYGRGVCGCCGVCVSAVEDGGQAGFGGADIFKFVSVGGALRVGLYVGQFCG